MRVLATGAAMDMEVRRLVRYWKEPLGAVLWRTEMLGKEGT